MNKSQLIKGLRDIYSPYNTFFIDLWGVIHNGIRLNPLSVEVLNQLEAKKKKIVLMTNAPRPGTSVANFLLKMGLNQKYFKYIFTSGDAALKALKSEKFGKFFFHIGSSRDEDLIKEFETNKKSIDNCDFILCTGLFDNYEESLNYYKSLLINKINLIMVCTNPDLIVHRGNKVEYCAGSIAKIFENLGGRAVYFGKPYPEIYEYCKKKNDKVLVIGDNLKTDIKGANNMMLDSLFITGGVHREEISFNEDNFDKILKKYSVKTKFIQEYLKW